MDSASSNSDRRKPFGVSIGVLVRSSQTLVYLVAFLVAYQLVLLATPDIRPRSLGTAKTNYVILCLRLLTKLSELIPI